MFILPAGIVIQFLGILSAIKIMKDKAIMPFDRWMWSMIVSLVPLIGIIVFQVFRRQVNTKEYSFFSERFIDRHLS